MPKRRRSRSDLPSHYAGVPLGGIGTGCVELGVDARFRNITINNNRTAAARMPFAPGAFVAVRAAQGEKVHTQILQPDSSIPFKESGVFPPYTQPEDLSWYGLYPTSNFRLKEGSFPLDLQWSCMAPVIPYDTEASTLPLFMSVLQFTNRTKEPFVVSGLFNWENIRGCTSAESPEERGLIRPVSYLPGDESLRPGGAVGSGLGGDMPRVTGISFGHEEPAMTNAEGNYCLIASPSDGVQVSYAAWCKDSEEDVKRVWDSFENLGNLQDLRSTDPLAYCGSVCASTSVAPGETRRILHLFTWYCPNYSVGGDDLGNAYTREYRDSLDVAEYGLKHARYFLSAVANWHKRFMKSSLPTWYTRMLINNCHVFSTNSMLTREGEFSMMETPQDAAMGVLDRHFYSSIGTLLFFPGFAERELELFSKTENEEEPGRVYRDLGTGTVRSPGYGGGEYEMTDLLAKFILLVYRNFVWTGRAVTLINLYPRLREIMEHAMRLDLDRDGIPEASGDSTTFRGWAMYGLSSYAGGLWIDAMLAYSKICRFMKHEQEADYYESRANTALHHFDRRLWKEKEGYYRLFHDAADASGESALTDEGCFSGQLAGPWYSEFLGLGVAFSYERINRALEAIDRIDSRPGGIAKGYSLSGLPLKNPKGFEGDPETDQCWPSYTVSYIACPHIYVGSVDKGMEIIRNVYQNLHVRGQRTYNQPLSWDPVRNEPTGSRQDRHMGALSIWHSFFALQGFRFNVPEQTLRIAPRLPEGVNHLTVPLFTPLTFGWLTYQVTLNPEYKQVLRISFDSPVFIRIIELAIPKTLKQPNVRMLINEDRAPTHSELIETEPRNLLRITLDTPLQVQHPIDITVD